MVKEDFQNEQEYFNKKRHTINRLILGSGVVCGLTSNNISLQVDNDNNIKIVFGESGVAVDSWGHEIVVPNNNKETYVLNEKGQKITKSQVTDTMYLYLVYKTCDGTEKVPAFSGASTCEKICESTRIEEDYEVVALSEKPSEVYPGVVHSGNARQDNGNGNNYIILAEDASSIDEAYKSMCIEIIEGKGNDQIRKISGYKGDTKKAIVTEDWQWQNNPDNTSRYAIISCPEQSLGNDSNQARENIKEWVKKTVSSCLSCDDEPKVFLIAIDRYLNVDDVETKKYAAYVYNNKLLSDLLTCHISDFNNPHKTTAEQIGITPATEVTSVEKLRNIGISKIFSPEDHIHDLKDGVVITEKIADRAVKAEKLGIDAVKLEHLNNEVIEKLLVQGENITIEPNINEKSIKISAGSAARAVINTGFYTFENKKISEESQFSDLIDSRLGPGDICVVLGFEKIPGHEKYIYIGSSEVFFGHKVLLCAKVNPDGKFIIGIRTKNIDEDIRVRWWAFKATEEIKDVSVNIKPSSVTLHPDEMQTFQAEVTGTENKDVKWSIKEGEPEGGSIEQDGSYKSPDDTGTFHVIAKSKADPSKSARATVMVVPLQGNGIIIEPYEVHMNVGDEPVEFTARVLNSVHITVRWGPKELISNKILVDDGPNSAVFYPKKAGKFSIEATSVDGKKKGRAYVEVLEKIEKRQAKTGRKRTI